MLLPRPLHNCKLRWYLFHPVSNLRKSWTQKAPHCPVWRRICATFINVAQWKKERLKCLKGFTAQELQCIEEEGRALGFVILKIDWKLSIIFITTLTLDIKGTLTKSKLWSSSSPSSWISRLVAHRPSWQSISRLLPLPPSLLLVIFMQSGFWQWPGSCFKNFLKSPSQSQSQCLSLQPSLVIFMQSVHLIRILTASRIMLQKLFEK